MDRVTAAIMGATACLIVTGFVILSLNGRDTASYAIFLGGPLVTGLFGSLLARRTAKVAADLQVVKDATNGQLAQSFAQVDAQFAAASIERQAIADSNGQDQSRQN